MNELQVFNFDELPVRTVQINEQPYFVGNDVAQILGYSNYKNAVKNHVDDEDKLSTRIEYAGQNRLVTVINESGIYNLIFAAAQQSINPEIKETAKKFKRFVTSEILPSIRKSGTFSVNPTIQELANNPELIQMLVEQLAKLNDSQSGTKEDLNYLKQTLTGEYVTPQDITAIKYMVKDKAEKYVDANGTQLTLEDVATTDIYELAQHNKRLKEQRRYDIGKAKSKILVATKKHLGMKGNAPNNHIKRRDVDRAIQFIKDMRYSEIA